MNFKNLSAKFCAWQKRRRYSRQIMSISFNGEFNGDQARTLSKFTKITP